MSELKTAPVLRCRRCGQPVVVAHLSTSSADPEGKLLYQLMRALEKTALCKYCLDQRNYYAAQGRLEDWEAGRP